MRYAVIGLGTFGQTIVETLVENHAEVVVIDYDKNKVEQIKDIATMALVLNSTNEAAMQAAQIDDVDAAIVALGDAQEQAILTTAILKKMGVYPIIARAANNLYAHVLKLVGADKVIIIEEQAGKDVAKRLLAPEIHEKIMLTTGHSLVEMEAKKEFIGKSLKELDIRNHFGVNVIAIQKKSTKVDEDGRVVETVEVNDLPGPGDIILEGEVLVVVGSEDDIEKMVLSERKK